jgi:hypothetical protein
MNLHQIILIIGVFSASLGIFLYYLKEENSNVNSKFLKILIQKSEYLKISASASVTIATLVWFFSTQIVNVNFLLLVAFLFTFPGDFILSRDLSKLFLALPMFGIAYLLIAIRGLMEIFTYPINLPVLILCLLAACIMIIYVLIRYASKLTPSILRYAAMIYSLIDLVLLFTGLAFLTTLITIAPGCGMILFVVSDMIAVANVGKTFTKKPLYDLFGGMMYFASLYAVVFYFLR